VIYRDEITEASRDAVHLHGVLGLGAHRVRLQRTKAAAMQSRGDMLAAPPIW
jgi:hypothetical protein